MNDTVKAAPFRSAILSGHALEATFTGAAMAVTLNGQPVLELNIDAGGECWLARKPGAPQPPALLQLALLAALEAISANRADLNAMRLHAGEWPEIKAELLRSGVAREAGPSLTVSPAMLWQLPQLWLPQAPAIYPQNHVRSGERWHPQRPAKPQGYVYERFIPWLGRSIAFRAASVEQDLHTMHKWMNDPRVAQFFQEEGDLDYQRAYLGGRLADPHMLPLIAEFDRVPFGYMEVYWAQENRLGPYYAADDYDRGWHVLVGEEAYSGGQFISAWLPSLMHYMFLDEPRTQRIVGEPAASHQRQVRNLERSGFAAIKDFDFPHKRATLVMLTREKFFSNRLWHPSPKA
ncbi:MULTISPECIES: GNAT family N-acetyltransferase [unclassified Duganella]|uniref:GNAT family N-acetyltransferase n=1 Tax=unclassified Duganella TaxID=2636909 RepID=UPI0018F75F76|nr:MULTISPECIES: GNAT family N-acetyltransferase [unclassified Duganella]